MPPRSTGVESILSPRSAPKPETVAVTVTETIVRTGSPSPAHSPRPPETCSSSSPSAQTPRDYSSSGGGGGSGRGSTSSHQSAQPATRHPTASATSATAADAAAGPKYLSYSIANPEEAIEMEPLVIGHRRRRSSLMNSPTASGPGALGVNSTSNSAAAGMAGAGVPRGAAGADLRIQTGSLGDEPKTIDEEGAEEADEMGGLLAGSTRGGPGRGRGPSSGSAGRRYTGGGGESDFDDDDDEDLRDDEETGLTRRERKRRRTKKRHNTRLDQRLVRDGGAAAAAAAAAAATITAEEKQEADQHVLKRSAVNVTLIGLWYVFSLSISLYNKWMFGEGRLNFQFPLFTTASHMLVQFTLASLVLYLFPSLRPHGADSRRRAGASDRGRSRHEPELLDRAIMSKWFYLTRIGPCGAATGLDIGLGNMSLKFITLTFYTMCKSSALGFVLCFAFVFRLETPTWRLVGIIAVMTIGVVMMVAGEVEFSLPGFILIISAAFFSGFRWGLTQMLLLRNPATSNPFSSIFFLAPVMFGTLLCIAIPVEGPVALVHGIADLAAQRGHAVAPLILLFPGCIAFCMTASEFALLQRTSVVTLSIAGICKEVVTIVAAALVFDDRLTPINLVGLVTTIGAISAYNWMKITKMRSDAQTDVVRQHMDPPLTPAPLGGGGGSGGSRSSSSSSPIIGLSDDEPASAVSAHRTGSFAAAEAPLITADGDFIPSPAHVRADAAGKTGGRLAAAV